ncbi:TRAP transporter small permease subunit [Corticibacter populi]|uniref:TRAP transporter small permease protein n=2 Tax=Corticibacter populi TaxID=1550736 RepID=A0A3M6R0V8_9BURK|nr:TRAP transporter small permease subunit [Corticibacter populi]
MRILASIIINIGRLNRLVGNILVWLALATVLVCFTVVVQRYFFATTQLWMQDLYVWLNGLMFMGVAGYALFRDNHVRVDIYYRPATLRGKAWRDLIGVVLFLAPFCTIVWIYAWPYVQRSWRLMEGSANPGGMPGLFVLKGFILVFIVLIALQGLAMALRSVLVLAGRQDLLPPLYRYQQD